jgi:hypothetical protein
MLWGSSACVTADAGYESSGDQVAVSPEPAQVTTIATLPGSWDLVGISASGRWLMSTDRVSRTVAIWSAIGDRTAVIGGVGSGPGEFQSIRSAGWIADQAWVYDHSLRRFTTIDLPSTAVGVLPVPAINVGDDPESRRVWQQAPRIAGLAQGPVIVLSGEQVPTTNSDRQPQSVKKIAVLEVDIAGDRPRLLVSAPAETCLRSWYSPDRARTLRLPLCNLPILAIGENGAVAIIEFLPATEDSITLIRGHIHTRGGMVLTCAASIAVGRVDESVHRDIAREISLLARRRSGLPKSSELPQFFGRSLGAAFDHDSILWVGIQSANESASYLRCPTAPDGKITVLAGPVMEVTGARNGGVYGILPGTSIDTSTAILRLSATR